MPRIISPGYDYYTVVKGSTSIDLSSIFPNVGTVYSDGIPLNLSKYGSASTAIERKGTLKDGFNGVISVEMFAENSVSTTPIDRAALDLGEGKADFRTIINRGGMFPHLPNTDGLVSPSLGSMAVKRTHQDGGTYEILMNINPLILITVVGGDVRDLNSPDVLAVIDGTGLLNPVGSINGLWFGNSSATKLASASYPIGGFVAATDPSNGSSVEVGLTSGGIPAARKVIIQ